MPENDNNFSSASVLERMMQPPQQPLLRPPTMAAIPDRRDFNELSVQSAGNIKITAANVDIAGGRQLQQIQPLQPTEDSQIVPVLHRIHSAIINTRSTAAEALQTELVTRMYPSIVKSAREGTLTVADLVTARPDPKFTRGYAPTEVMQLAEIMTENNFAGGGVSMRNFSSARSVTRAKANYVSDMLRVMETGQEVLGTRDFNSQIEMMNNLAMGNMPGERSIYNTPPAVLKRKLEAISTIAHNNLAPMDTVVSGILESQQYRANNFGRVIDPLTGKRDAAGSFINAVQTEDFVRKLAKAIGRTDEPFVTRLRHTDLDLQRRFRNSRAFNQLTAFSYLRESGVISPETYNAGMGTFYGQGREAFEQFFRDKYVDRSGATFYGHSSADIARFAEYAESRMPDSALARIVAAGRRTQALAVNSEFSRNYARELQKKVNFKLEQEGITVPDANLRTQNTITEYVLSKTIKDLSLTESDYTVRGEVRPDGPRMGRTHLERQRRLANLTVVAKTEGKDLRQLAEADPVLSKLFANGVNSAYQQTASDLGLLPVKNRVIEALIGNKYTDIPDPVIRETRLAYDRFARLNLDTAGQRTMEYLEKRPQYRNYVQKLRSYEQQITAKDQLLLADTLPGDRETYLAWKLKQETWNKRDITYGGRPTTAVKAFFAEQGAAFSGFFTSREDSLLFGRGTGELLGAKFGLGVSPSAKFQQAVQAKPSMLMTGAMGGLGALVDMGMLSSVEYDRFNKEYARIRADPNSKREDYYAFANRAINFSGAIKSQVYSDTGSLEQAQNVDRIYRSGVRKALDPEVEKGKITDERAPGWYSRARTRITSLEGWKHILGGISLSRALVSGLAWGGAAALAGLATGGLISIPAFGVGFLKGALSSVAIDVGAGLFGAETAEEREKRLGPGSMFADIATARKFGVSTSTIDYLRSVSGQGKGGSHVISGQLVIVEGGKYKTGLVNGKMSN